MAIQIVRKTIGSLAVRIARVLCSRAGLMQRIFLASGAIVVVGCILCVGYIFIMGRMFTSLSLAGVMKHTLQPLVLFVGVALCGLIDIVLWLKLDPARFLVSPPSASSSPSALPEQGKADYSDSQEAAHGGNGQGTSIDRNVSHKNVQGIIPQDEPNQPRENAQQLADRNQSPADGSVQSTQPLAVRTLGQKLPILRDPTKLQESVSAPRARPQPQIFRRFIVPREGNSLERCEDKLDFNHEDARYAVADGVGTSFLPGRWAKILTNHYVHLKKNLQNEPDIVDWLKGCSEEWHTWVKDEWLPPAIEASGQEDWSREITRGAAATFVGCSFSREALKQQPGETEIVVHVAGDAEFFLLAPNAEKWECVHSFRLKLEEFGQMTETLATPEYRVRRDSKRLYLSRHIAKEGWLIVLTTDALAQWILQHMSVGNNPWVRLLGIIRPEDFTEFVYTHRRSGELEVDDTTMVIIPVIVDVPKVT